MGDETIRGVLAENDVSLPVENEVIQSWIASAENRQLAMLIVAIPGTLLILLGLLWQKRKQIIIESG